MYLKKLKALIPPPECPECAGNPELYRQTDDRLGIKLPQDYYDFIAAYGAGMFGNWLVVYNPFTKNPNLNLFRQLEEWGDSYREVKSYYGEDCEYGEGYPFEFYPEKNGLVLWGWIDGGGFSFYWLPKVDKWTIVVYDDADYYKEFDMTMTEFIYNLMLGRTEFEDLTNNVTDDPFCFEKWTDQGE